jgi:hypothetical protein
VMSTDGVGAQGRTLNNTPVKTSRFWASSHVKTLPKSLIACYPVQNLQRAMVPEAPALTGDVHAAPAMGM